MALGLGNEPIRANLYFSFKYKQGIDLHDSRLPMLAMRLTLMRRLIEPAKSTPISIEEKIRSKRKERLEVNGFGGKQTDF